MKRIIFSLTIILVCFYVYAQNYQISFSASGESSVVSKVQVLNLSQGTTMELNGTDILQLVGVVGTKEINFQRNQLIVYPNPSGQTVNVMFSQDGNEVAELKIFHISGELIIQKTMELKDKKLQCEISGLSNGIYLVMLSVPGRNYAEKIIITSENTGIPDIKLQDINSPMQIDKTLKAGTSLVQMQYNEGERILFKGISGNYSRIVTLIPNKNDVLNFEFVACKDGNNKHYPVVTIGTQTWMAENLRTTKYNDETDIPLIEDAGSWSGLSTAGFCWYDNNYSGYGANGALYNWYAVNTGKVCPSGWHVPAYSEWDEMVTFLTNDGNSGTEGTVIKSINGWSNGNDRYGFGAIPTGFRSTDGSFYSVSTLTFWWSSTPGAFSISGKRLMNNTTILEGFGLSHTGGYSIRCLKGSK